VEQHHRAFLHVKCRPTQNHPAHSTCSTVGDLTMACTRTSSSLGFPWASGKRVFAFPPKSSWQGRLEHSKIPSWTWTTNLGWSIPSMEKNWGNYHHRPPISGKSGDCLLGHILQFCSDRPRNCALRVSTGTCWSACVSYMIYNYHIYIYTQLRLSGDIPYNWGIAIDMLWL